MTPPTPPHLLADLYAGLAQILAEAGKGKLPAWFGRRGRNWPLFVPAKSLAAQLDTPLLAQAVAAMAEVGRGARLNGCHRLFTGNGRPPIMLYESWHVDGRFPSPATFAVQTVYRQAGLNLTGELPDHAAVELEFLSFLAEREEEDAGQAQQWRTARRRFLKDHVNRWLPQVARQLAQSNDKAWAAIGLLLTAVLALPHRARSSHTRAMLGLPTLTAVADCTLCGFCVQICPTRALRISEDEQATRLYLLPASCIHCGKCAAVCDEQVMVMDRGSVAGTAVTEYLGKLGADSVETAVLLRQSPRLACPRCGQATVSQAEITAIVSRLGEHPAWLDYCLNCR